MWKTETGMVNLYDEVAFEIRTQVEHSVGISERFETFLDTNLMCLTDPPDTWSRLVFLAVETSAIAHNKLSCDERHAYEFAHVDFHSIFSCQYSRNADRDDRGNRWRIPHRKLITMGHKAIQAIMKPPRGFMMAGTGLLLFYS
jgi:hypothetical protein